MNIPGRTLSRSGRATSFVSVHHTSEEPGADRTFSYNFTRNYSRAYSRAKSRSKSRAKSRAESHAMNVERKLSHNVERKLSHN